MTLKRYDDFTHFFNLTLVITMTLKLTSSEKKPALINIFPKILIIFSNTKWSVGTFSFIGPNISSHIKKNFIKNIAKRNNYFGDILNQMIHKRMFKLRMKDLSTFRNENRGTIFSNFISLFYQELKIFNDQVITVVNIQTLRESQRQN